MKIRNNCDFIVVLKDNAELKGGRSMSDSESKFTQGDDRQVGSQITEPVVNKTESPGASGAFRNNIDEANHFSRPNPNHNRKESELWIR